MNCTMVWVNVNGSSMMDFVRKYEAARYVPERRERNDGRKVGMGIGLG